MHLLEMIQCCPFWHLYKTNRKQDSSFLFISILAPMSVLLSNVWVTVLRWTRAWVCPVTVVLFYQKILDMYWVWGCSVLTDWGAYPPLTVKLNPHWVLNISGPGLYCMMTSCQDHCIQLFKYLSLLKWWKHFRLMTNNYKAHFIPHNTVSSWLRSLYIT